MHTILRLLRLRRLRGVLREGGERIHDGVDGGEVRGVENVGSLNAKLQRARFLYGDCLAQVHIKNDLSGPFDGVAPGITERSAIRICAGARGSGPSGPERRSWRAEGRGVEPFRCGWIAH